MTFNFVIDANVSLGSDSRITAQAVDFVPNIADYSATNTVTSFRYSNHVLAFNQFTFREALRNVHSF